MLIAAGAAILVWGRHFTTSHDVVEGGGVTVLIEHPAPLAPWVSFVALGAGALLVALDIRRKA